MFYMSCYRFMPEYFKSFFDVSNETYTTIVSYPQNNILHTNYDFYNHLIENGLTTDSSGNYFIIQHLMVHMNSQPMKIVSLMIRMQLANQPLKEFSLCLKLI